VAIRQAKQRDLPAVREQEHLLDDGLGEDGLVRHDPQRVDPVLQRLERGENVLVARCGRDGGGVA